MKIKEIMTTKIVSLKPDDNVLVSLRLLFQKEISGLPVISAAGTLVGMFTEKDILKQILPSYLEKVGRFIYDEDPKSIKQKLQGLANIPVSQLMRKEVVTVTEDTPLVEAARIMLTQEVRRVPVLAESGKVVGMVSRGDVVKALAENYGEID